MNCLRQCERLLTSVLAFSLQQSGLSLPKSPTLHSFKDKVPEGRSACPQKAVSRHEPTPAPGLVVSTRYLPVKDTVSSWEQDFMEDHFCHDAPDRPDVHYQISGG